MERILVDTGPLVAVLSKADQHHAACAAASQQLARPLLTSWPVLTEAVYLLRYRQDHVQKLFGFLVHGLIKTSASTDSPTDLLQSWCRN